MIPKHESITITLLPHTFNYKKQTNKLTFHCQFAPLITQLKMEGRETTFLILPPDVACCPCLSLFFSCFSSFLGLLSVCSVASKTYFLIPFITRPPLAIPNDLFGNSSSFVPFSPLWHYLLEMKNPIPHSPKYGHFPLPITFVFIFINTRKIPQNVNTIFEPLCSAAK